MRLKCKLRKGMDFPGFVSKVTFTTVDGSEIPVNSLTSWGNGSLSPTIYRQGFYTSKRWLGRGFQPSTATNHFLNLQSGVIFTCLLIHQTMQGPTWFDTPGARLLVFFMGRETWLILVGCSNGFWEHLENSRSGNSGDDLWLMFPLPATLRNAGWQKSSIENDNNPGGDFCWEEEHFEG